MIFERVFTEIRLKFMLLMKNVIVALLPAVHKSPDRVIFLHAKNGDRAIFPLEKIIGHPSLSGWLTL